MGVNTTKSLMTIVQNIKCIQIDHFAILCKITLSITYYITLVLNLIGQHRLQFQFPFPQSSKSSKVFVFPSFLESDKLEEK